MKSTKFTELYIQKNRNRDIDQIESDPLTALVVKKISAKTVIETLRKSQWEENEIEEVLGAALQLMSKQR